MLQNGAAMTDATAIVTGTSHSCALKTNGSVRCWGQSVWGQVGDGTTGAGGMRLQGVQVLL